MSRWIRRKVSCRIRLTHGTSAGEHGPYGSYKACHCRYWVLDPARMVIFVVSLLLITLGSRRAVHLDKNSTESEAEGIYGSLSTRQRQHHVTL